eukprot:768622-Hanusia_phi.AAC.6
MSSRSGSASSMPCMRCRKRRSCRMTRDRTGSGNGPASPETMEPRWPCLRGVQRLSNSRRASRDVLNEEAEPRARDEGVDELDKLLRGGGGLRRPHGQQEAEMMLEPAGDGQALGGGATRAPLRALLPPRIRHQVVPLRAAALPHLPHLDPLLEHQHVSPQRLCQHVSPGDPAGSKIRRQLLYPPC